MFYKNRKLKPVELMYLDIHHHQMNKQLMKHYNFQPKEFLNFVHDVNLDKITKNKNLFENIKNLPGEKIIYTNGDENYARRVLKKLGIHKLFSYILDIERSNYIPKPIIDPLISFLEEKRINLNNCVYFEDLQKNLENAHKYGITTIHIKEKDFDNIKIESFIDFRFSSLIFHRRVFLTKRHFPKERRKVIEENLIIQPFFKRFYS